MLRKKTKPRARQLAALSTRGNEKASRLFLAATPSWISGLARLVDFGGQFDSYNTFQNDSEADFSALQSDWKMVGQDIRSAEESFAKEHRSLSRTPIKTTVATGARRS